MMTSFLNFQTQQDMHCPPPSSPSSQRHNTTTIPADDGSSTFRPISSSRRGNNSACPLLVLILLLFSTTLASGRIVGHHHRLQQQLVVDPLETTSTAEDEVVTMLDGKIMLLPSSRRVVSGADEHVCAKASDRNATLLQSLSKSTGQSVLLHPQQQFKIAYCELSAQSADESSAEGGCALGSNCATIYRWTKALIHPALTAAQLLQFDMDVTYADQVLIPVDCLCVLNWAQTFRGQGPIILE